MDRRDFLKMAATTVGFAVVNPLAVIPEYSSTVTLGEMVPAGTPFIHIDAATKMVTVDANGCTIQELHEYLSHHWGRIEDAPDVSNMW